MSDTSLGTSRPLALDTQAFVSRSAPLAQRGMRLLGELALVDPRRASAVIQPRNARRVRQLISLGLGRISSVALSPLGDMLAVASSAGVYAVQSDNLLPTEVFETESPALHVAFADGGGRLACACGDRTIRLLAVSKTNRGVVTVTPEPITFDSPNGVGWLRFAAQDRMLLGVSQRGSVELWLVGDSADQAELGVPIVLLQDGGTLDTVALSPDGSILAMGVRRPGRGRASAVFLWPLDQVVPEDPSLPPPWELPADERGRRTTSLAFSAQTGLMASGCDDGRICLWQVRRTPHGNLRGSLLDTLVGEDGAGGTTALAFSLDGRLLVSGTGHGHLQMWTVRDGALVAGSVAHAGAVGQVVFSADGRTVFSVGADEMLCSWPASSLGVAPPDGMAEPGAALTFTPPLTCLTLLGRSNSAGSGDALLVAGTSQGDLLSWTVSRSASGEPIAGETGPGAWARGHDDSVVCVARAPGGGLVATGSLDTCVRLWRLSKGADAGTLHLTPLTTLSEHGAAVREVAFSPDGTVLAVGIQNGIVWLWPLEELLSGGEPDQPVAPVQLLRQSNVLWGMAFSPDWTHLAAGCYDNRVLTWRIERNAAGGHVCPDPPLALRGHAAAVQSVCFSPDGRLVASAGHDNTARLWSLDPSRPNGAPGQESPAGGAGNTRTGTDEVSAPVEADVPEPFSLRGHTGSVTAVAFSPQGRLLATGSADTSIRLWKVSNGAALKTLRGHTAAVTGVAFSPDGEWLASVSADGTARLWGVGA